MWTHKIENGVFQVEVALQVIVLLGVRQCFTDQATVTLARGQVVTFNIRGVDLLVAYQLCDDLRRTKHDAPVDCNDPSPCAMFVDLSITQCRVQHPRRVLAWSTWPTSSRWRFRRTVIGNECCDIRRQL